MRAGCAALWLWPAVALAWPVDWVHDVEPDQAKFISLPKVDWVEVDDPSVASAQWVEPSHDLVIEGLKPGRAVLLIGADDKVAAWRLRVGGKPVTDERRFLAAQKACPDLTATPLEEVKLTVTIKTEACRAALFALFETDAFEARHLELTFDGAVLQAQLKRLQAAIDHIVKGKVTARYVGAGLVLEGSQVTRAEYRRVLWAVLKQTLGRFALDNRVDIEEPATDVDAGRSDDRR